MGALITSARPGNASARGLIVRFVCTVAAILLYGWINFILNPATAPGQALVAVAYMGQTIATGTVEVEAVAPALFSADGSGTGLPAGTVQYSGPDNNSTVALATYDATLGWQPIAVDLSDAQELVLLNLYGTGIRGRSSIAAVTATIGGQAVSVNSAGPQGQVAGLDQLVLGPLPLSLRGAGTVPVVVTVDGRVANRLNVPIR